MSRGGMLVWEADDGSIDGKLFQNLYQACRVFRSREWAIGNCRKERKATNKKEKDLSTRLLSLKTVEKRYSRPFVVIFYVIHMNMSVVRNQSYRSVEMFQIQHLGAMFSVSVFAL